MIEAIIKTGGKQYKVGPGATILIEKLPGNVGDAIQFTEVLLVTGEPNKIGTPFVQGAHVAAKILAAEKGKKVIIYKYKRRKGYHKTQGHRQKLTRVEITDIKV